MKKEDYEILKKAREKELKINSPNFIAEYPNALNDELCDEIIKFADKHIEVNPSLNRSVATESTKTSLRKDWFFFIHTKFDFAIPINNLLNEYLKQYSDEYMGAFYTGRYSSFDQKLQVTPAGGGFHNWHCEHSHYVYCDRVLAWMFYLNNIELGGETEFLHQKCRIKPEKGKLVIFPAAFTHCHRGNPPLKDTKYVVTGWFNLCRE